MGRSRQNSFLGKTTGLYGLNVKVSRDTLYFVDNICKKEGLSRSALVERCIQTYAELTEVYIDVPQSALKKHLSFLLELQDLCTRVETVVGGLVTDIK